ncbi:putative endonuclease V [Helianthus annuus]|nr:putative endonuclease V [Helianthus annuus]
MQAPVFVQLLKKMQDSSHSCYPQVLLVSVLLMIDGNGILHPRGMCFCFGSACHLGVLADLPTIGVGKNVSHIKATNGSIILVIFIFVSRGVNEPSRTRAQLGSSSARYVCIAWLGSSLLL